VVAAKAVAPRAREFLRSAIASRRFIANLARRMDGHEFKQNFTIWEFGLAIDVLLD